MMTFPINMEIYDGSKPPTSFDFPRHYRIFTRIEEMSATSAMFVFHSAPDWWRFSFVISRHSIIFFSVQNG